MNATRGRHGQQRAADTLLFALGARRLHANLQAGRVISLAETAVIINASHKYDRALSASDVQRIESSALKKIRARMGRLPWVLN